MEDPIFDVSSAASVAAAVMTSGGRSSTDEKSDLLLAIIAVRGRGTSSTISEKERLFCCV